MDDWSKIVPLTENQALLTVEGYFLSCGLEPSKINHSDNKTSEKSPDFLVMNEGQEYLLCEVKTPGHYINQNSGLYLWENVYNRLKDRLRTARKQFESYDPDHLLPRIVSFTSNHPQLNFTHCQSVLVGAMILNQQILRDFRTEPTFKYSEKNKRNIDMILWCQVNRITKKIFETEHFINSESKHFDKTKEISQKLATYKRYVFEY